MFCAPYCVGKTIMTALFGVPSADPTSRAASLEESLSFRSQEDCELLIWRFCLSSVGGLQWHLRSAACLDPLCPREQKAL